LRDSTEGSLESKKDNNNLKVTVNVTGRKSSQLQTPKKQTPTTKEPQLSSSSHKKVVTFDDPYNTQSQQQSGVKIH
jgi:hypothetical protein